MQNRKCQSFFSFLFFSFNINITNYTFLKKKIIIIYFTHDDGRRDK